MSLTTPSLLDSDCFVGLGMPPVDWMDLPTIHREVIHTLGFYSLELSQSSENQQIKCINFTPATRTWQIVGADDISVPCWVERQVYQGQYESWKFVPVVNLSQLEDNRLEGNERVSFYGSNGRMYLRLSYDPQLYTYRQHRLYYDSNPILSQTMDGAALGTLVNGMPSSFSPLITWRAIKSLIPKMVARASASENKPGKELLSAWGAMLADAKEELKEWNQRWDVYCWSSRDGQRGRRRKQIISRGGWMGNFPGYRS